MSHPWRRRSVGLLGGLAVVWTAWDDSGLGEPSKRWVIVVTVVVAVLVADRLPALARLLDAPGAVPVVLAISLATVYACVPETDQVAPVAVAILAIEGVEIIGRQTLSWWWHGALAWLVLWAGIYGATGRSSALVGALFAWWPVLALPLLRPAVRQVRQVCRVRRTESPHGLLVHLGAVGVAGGAALVVARTGAVQPTIEPALRSVAIWWPMSALVVVVLLSVFDAPSAKQSVGTA